MIAASTVWPALPVSLFLIGFVVPWTIEIGSFGLSMSRIVLLIMVLPCLLRWATGRAGPRNPVDLLVLAYCFWSVLSIAMVHDLREAIETGGMQTVETAGAYFLARCFIQSADAFKAVVRLLFITTVILLPFAIIEAVTGWNISMAMFGAVLPTYAVSYDGMRWGLKRVQGVFEHPILFGVSTGCILALVHLVLGRDAPSAKRWFCSALVLATAFLSLSSGPFTAIAGQLGLLGWASLTRKIPNNWWILTGIVAAMFLAIDLVSNQSVMQFYISRFSFDPNTAWLRLLIWDYGTASVFAHPWFGTGFGSWDHPPWMSDSMDMFWLLPAVRHGIPAGLFMLLIPIVTVIMIGTRSGLDERANQYRLAFLVVVTSYFIVGWTVHFWGAAYLGFLFIAGSGMWLAAVPKHAPKRSDFRRGGAFATRPQLAGVVP